MTKRCNIALSLVLHNEASHIPRLAEAVKRQTIEPAGIYVTDNNSSDDSATLLKDLLPGAHINITGNNPGYGAAHNINMQRAFDDGAGAVLILNTDTEPDTDCISSIDNILKSQPETGMIAPLILYGGQGKKTMKIQSLRQKADLKKGRIKNIDNRKDINEIPVPQFETVNYFSGTACVITKKMYDEMGGFTKDNFLYGEELDYSFRAFQKGIRIIAAKDVRIWHYHDWSKKNKDGLCREYYYINRNRIKYFRKFGLKAGLFLFIANEVLVSPFRIRWALRKGGKKLISCFYRGIINGLKGDERKNVL